MNNSHDRAYQTQPRHAFEKVKAPIFIVGCGRSGTTLLFDLLSQHPKLARTIGYPDGEDHQGWIEHGQCVMAGIGNNQHKDYNSGINGYHYCLHMTAEAVNDEIKNKMHLHYLGLTKGKTDIRILNKQPHLSNKLGYLLGIFSDAKIIHIIRDCEPMVASWIAVMKNHPSLQAYLPSQEEFPCFWLFEKPKLHAETTATTLSKHFSLNDNANVWIDYWLKVNDGIEKQMRRNLSQLLSIRYEDLLAKPDKVLEKIEKFTELPQFNYSTSHIHVNRAMKHEKLISKETRRLIKVKTDSLRQAFGFKQVPGKAVKASLFTL